MKKVFVLILLCLSFYNTNAQWRKLNPPCGNLTYGVVKLGDTLFAVSSGSNYSVIMSIDNGLHWDHYSNAPVFILGLPSLAVINNQLIGWSFTGQLNLYTVNRSGFNLINSDSTIHTYSIQTFASRIYLATDSGIYTSPRVDLPFSFLGLGNFSVVNMIEKGDTFFASTWENGIWMSPDYGHTWYDENIGITDSFNLCLTAGNGHLFAGTNYGYVFVSDNNGKTWNSVNAGFADLNVTDLFATANNVFLVTDDSGMFVSKNNGDTWQPCNNGIDPSSVNYPYTVTPSSLVAIDDTVFVCSRTGLYAYNESKDIWMNRNNGNDMESYSNFVFGDTIIAGMEDGAYVSVDNGNSWQFSGIGGNIVYKIVAIGDTLYAASFWNGGVYRSLNHGVSWSRLNLNSVYNNGWVIAYNSGNKILYAATGDSGIVYKRISDNNWSKQSIPIVMTSVFDLTVDKENNLYAGAATGNYKLSADSQQWKLFNNSQQIPAYRLTCVGNAVIATDGEDIFRLDSAGTSWIFSDTGIASNRVLSVFAFNSILYAGAEDGIYMSSDTGITWQILHGSPGNVLSLSTKGNYFVAGNTEGLWTNESVQQATLNVKSDDNFSLFPNPANNILNVKASFTGSGEKRIIEVLNLEGQTVLQQETFTVVTAVNIYVLPQGIYFVRVTETEGYSSVKKFIKQ